MHQGGGGGVRYTFLDHWNWVYFMIIHIYLYIKTCVQGTFILNVFGSVYVYV